MKPITKVKPKLCPSIPCPRCKHYVPIRPDEVWYKYCELYLFPEDCECDEFEEVR